MNIPFLKYQKIYYIFSAILAGASLVFIFLFGLDPGIDFQGGSILELEFEERPESLIIEEKLKEMDLGEITIQPTGEKGVILRLKTIDESTRQEILKNLEEISLLKALRSEDIGPAIGKEIREKTMILIVISLAALLFYVAISFRKVSFPFSSWQFGIISIIALSFDILILLGFLSLFGEFYNVQLSIPIITALLTVLGYTINDKVIVFDRVRENILKGRRGDIRDLVDKSLSQILWRSLSTGTCSLLVLFFIFFLGGETLKYFALTLIIGIVVGTYSSLFLAAPLLVSWLELKKIR